MQAPRTALLNVHDKLTDEAHHLEDIVASQFGLQLNSVMPKKTESTINL